MGTFYREATLCPVCGADSRKHCALEEENGGTCPWEEMGDEPPEADEEIYHNSDRPSTVREQYEAAWKLKQSLR